MAKKSGPKPNTRTKRATDALNALETPQKRGIKNQNARDIVTLCRKEVNRAIKTLVDIMSDAKAEKRARIMAAKILIERGYGQAPRHVVHTMAASLHVDELEQAARIILERRRAIDAPKPLQGKDK